MKLILFLSVLITGLVVLMVGQSTFLQDSSVSEPNTVNHALSSQAFDRCAENTENAGKHFLYHEEIGNNVVRDMYKLCGATIHEDVCPSNREGSGSAFTYKTTPYTVPSKAKDLQGNCGLLLSEIRQGRTPTPECLRTWETITNVLCSTYDLSKRTAAEAAEDVRTSELPQMEIVDN